jgi:hypothetical protein
LTAVLWPAAIALPWGFEFVRVRAEARAAVPSYERAEAPQITVRLGDEENRGHQVRFVFWTEADSSEQRLQFEVIYGL